MTDGKDAEIIDFHPDVGGSAIPLDQMSQDQLRTQLIKAAEQHASLEGRLETLQSASPVNMPLNVLEIARVKKNKLMLKDRLQSIKAKLLPDIIA